MKVKTESEEESLSTVPHDGIVVEGLIKSFGHFPALRGLDLNLPKGCFLTITHSPERGLQICDRVSIMRQGRIVHMGDTRIGLDDFREVYYERTHRRDA